MIVQSIGNRSPRDKEPELLNHIETAVERPATRGKGKDWPFWDVLWFLSSVFETTIIEPSSLANQASTVW